MIGMQDIILLISKSQRDLKLKKKIYIIVGSSRNPGNTWTVANELKNFKETELVDLLSLEVSYFDYEHNNRDDDFIPLMKRMLSDASAIVFLTPIYWYTMSAVMKTFLDRFSDLLKIEKELGRRLRGLSMAVLSTSESEDAPFHFDEPFQLSAEYLGMNYCGYEHTVVSNSLLQGESKKKALNLMLNLTEKS